MTTVTEVLNAVRQMPIQDQKEVFIELREALVNQGVDVKPDDDDDWLPPNFTEELTEAFYEAKCRALGHEVK